MVQRFSGGFKNIKVPEIVHKDDSINSNSIQGWSKVASNFQYFSHRTKNSLHMKLYGDFDENSARELLSALSENGSNAQQIFIDTNDLSHIHPFGRRLFRKKLHHLSRRFIHLTFIGKNKDSISPEKSFGFD